MSWTVRLRIPERVLQRPVTVGGEPAGDLAGVIEAWDVDPDALWMLFARGSTTIDHGCGASCTLAFADWQDGCTRHQGAHGARVC